MSRLYLDTEFNGHGGELISLALAAPDDKHWYGELPLPHGIDPWVAEHVIPHTGAKVMLPDLFRASLSEYLRTRSGATIYADWPDDFAHLMRLMSGPEYAQSFMIPCTMRLIVTPDGEPKPAIPHHALSDAVALMNWHIESGDRGADPTSSGRVT